MDSMLKYLINYLLYIWKRVFILYLVDFGLYLWFKYFRGRVKIVSLRLIWDICDTVLKSKGFGKVVKG